MTTDKLTYNIYFNPDKNQTTGDKIFLTNPPARLVWEIYNSNNELDNSFVLEKEGNIIFFDVATPIFGLKTIKFYSETFSKENDIVKEEMTFLTEISVSIQITDIFIENPFENIDNAGLKYFFEYHSISNDFYRCEISKIGYDGNPTEINGNAILHYANIKDVFEPIRGSGLTINLEASQNLTLEDLYTEDEAQHRVKLYKNGTILFVGFIKPDGIFTDFVKDRWELSIECVDGLGLLKNLSFVKENGLHFTGKMTELEIIYNCLKRTNIYLPINVFIPIEFAGMNGKLLEQVKLNTERFYREDGKSTGDSTIMDCESVLKSILEKYSAVITQQEGEWYIYRFSELRGDLKFEKYTNGIWSNEKNILVDKLIGSHIDDFQIFHCNENQKINIEGSTKKFRVSYKYGMSLNSAFENPNLYHSNGILQGWTISDYSKVELLPNKGVKFKESLGSQTLNPILLSKSIALKKDEKIVIDSSFKTSEKWCGYFLDVRMSNGTEEWYLITLTNNQSRTDSNGTINPSPITINGFQWVKVGDTISTPFYEVGIPYVDYIDKTGWNNNTEASWSGTSQIANKSFELPSSPIQGNLNMKITKFYGAHSWVYINSSRTNQYDTILGDLELYKIDVKGSPEEVKATNNVQGEFHTSERKGILSSNIKENITVYNGDIPSSLWVGTIFKFDNTPTDLWRRKHSNEAKPILQIMAEEPLRVNAKPYRVFSGDVFGHIPYVSNISINNLGVNFQILEYKFDTSKNISFLKSRQIFNDEIESNYNYSLDYGNVVKPTIVG